MSYKENIDIQDFFSASNMLDEQRAYKKEQRRLKNGNK